jgi:hypothetical protein
MIMKHSRRDEKNCALSGGRCSGAVGHGYLHEGPVALKSNERRVEQFYTATRSASVLELHKKLDLSRRQALKRLAGVRNGEFAAV